MEQSGQAGTSEQELWEGAGTEDAQWQEATPAEADGTGLGGDEGGPGVGQVPD